jgi:gliding motility-associated peptidyl-prolyl isomerase
MKTLFRYIVIIIFFFIGFLSCSKPEARKPISKTENNFIKASIEINKIINKNQEAFFADLMEKDTVHKYINSKHGFWYYIKSKKDSLGAKPQKGDEVIINYEIRSINGEVILPKNRLGSYGQKNKADRLYKVDGESFIQGVQDAIKQLKVGETAVLLLPSNKAFGVTGFEDYIKPNQPLIIEVYLKKINNNSKN